MRLPRLRTLRPIAVTLALLSCTENGPTGPNLNPTTRLNLSGSSGSVVISQVYGGGGNSGATIKNDFIELFNNGSTAVDLTGWSVQYASTSGSFSSATPLSGTLAAGHYLLIQEAAGSGGTVSLSPDITGTIAMSGTDGKVALVRTTALLPCAATAAPCSTSQLAQIVDMVGYGSANLFEGGAAAQVLTNTTSSLRNGSGCTDTDRNSADFTRVTPTAATVHNSATSPHVCPPVSNPVDRVTVSPLTATLSYKGTQQLTANVFSPANADITATFPASWSSSDPSLATVSKTGLVTAVGIGDVVITATSTYQTAQATLHLSPPPPPPAVHFSELHYDNSGTDVNEKIEIAGPAGTDLSGWHIVLYGGDAVPDFTAYSDTPLDIDIPATCGTTGVIVVDYPVNGIKNAKSNNVGNPAGMALVDNTGAVVEFLSYEGSFTAVGGPAAGLTSTDMGVSEDNPVPAAGNSLHRDSYGIWSPPSAQDFGLCNGSGGTPPPTSNRITFSGRLSSDPALPVGFEDQLFATEKTVSGSTVSTTITWTSETPAIATIDAQGVFHGVSAGNAVLRATASDGTTGTTTLAVTVNTFSNTADWSGNLEFGTPSGHAQSGDLLITHDQFTASFNKTRNIPNWVSAKLDASHYGTGADRCDCFTYDPIVSDSGGVRYTTDVYTGEGSVWNRGHLLRSADVEASAGDNSIAYLFTNIAPQSAQMNQGPWAQEENFLGDLAKTGGKDVYQIIGVSGVSASEEHLIKADVTIPAYFWKVAVIVPHGRKLADIHSYSDLQVIAVIMPNIANVNGDWTTYKTTVHAVEQLSGYDLLNNLPDDIELLVENNDRPPTASLTGDAGGVEGGSISLDGSGSTDPDGDVLTYSWDFGDGSTGTGAHVTHAYADNGQYIVTLTVADPIGAKSTTTTVETITNAAPSGLFASPAPVNEGSSFNLSIDNVTDPGSADVAAGFSYRFDCGTGFGGWSSSSSTSCVAGDNPGSSVAAEVKDKDGATAHYDGTVVINNVAPTAVFSNNGPVNEGGSFTLRLDGATDASAADVAAGFQYRFDCGSGPGAWQSSATASCAAPNHGTYSVSGEVKDKDGDESIYNSSVTVNNVAPTAVFLYSGSVNEGSPFTLAMDNGTDSPADIAAGFEYRFDCGTGFGSWGTATSVSCPTTDNGAPNVAGEIRDHDGAVSLYNGTVNVNNVAPTVVVDAAAPITSGTTFALSAGFADPGQSDAPWSYTINWGDGSTSGTRSVEGAIPASHQYFVTGSYTITLTVTDKDGGVGSKSITLQVNPVTTSMDVTQSQINTSNSGNGIVKVTVLGNSSFSASSIVLSTVRIGSVHPATEGNGAYKVQVADINRDGIADLVAQFVRSDLAAGGSLNGSTLTLNATLTDGRQIQSTATVSVK